MPAYPNRVRSAKMGGLVNPPRKPASDHAITLFYEPFLQAFDPDLRKGLGVWYTPPEIVHYMVGRVDSINDRSIGPACRWTCGR